MSQLVACSFCHRQYDVSAMHQGERVRCGCGASIVVPEASSIAAPARHCVACGGSLAEEATRCGYCDSEVLAQPEEVGPACPECFARLPAGAQFCTGCGVAIRPESIKTTRADAKCPRCNEELVRRDFTAAHYTECTSCGGLWLDYECFERLVASKDGAAFKSIVAVNKQTLGSREPRAVDTTRYVKCLVCGSFMPRKVFAGCSGVIIDWCRGHGFWFDSTELEQIVRFVKSGGLERAKKLEDARAKARRTETIRRQSTISRMGALTGPVPQRQVYDGGDWLGLGVACLFELLL